MLSDAALSCNIKQVSAAQHPVPQFGIPVAVQQEAGVSCITGVMQVAIALALHATGGVSWNPCLQLWAHLDPHTR